MPQPNNTLPDDAPPVLDSWGQIYAFVLVVHVLFIVFTYLFSQYYS